MSVATMPACPASIHTKTQQSSIPLAEKTFMDVERYRIHFHVC